MNTTGHPTALTKPNSNNYDPSNIPLPPGTPPSVLQGRQQTQFHHHQQQQQLHQQHQNPILHQQHQNPTLHQQQQHYHMQQQQQQHLQQQQQQLQQQQQQQQQQQIFGGIRQPVTFETLAKRQENVVASTLQQYGPGAVNTSFNHQLNSTSMIPRAPNHMNLSTLHHHHQQQQQHQLQYNHQQQQQLLPQQRFTIYDPLTGQTVIRTQPPPVYPVIRSEPSVAPTMARMESNTPTYHISPIKQPVSQPSSFVNRSGANINVKLLNNITSTVASSTKSSDLSTEVASPSHAPASPPLDALKIQRNELAIQDRPRESSPSRTSPPPRVDILSEVRERCETMTLNQMLEEHRSLKQKLEESQLRRSALEKEINNIVRNAPGQNVELNPAFKRKKTQKNEFDAKCKDINDAIKLVVDKLAKKYSHKIHDQDMRQPLQSRKIQRAKMSTAAHAPASSKKTYDKDDTSVLFNLDDGHLWCNLCDVHFKSLKAFCDHLHQRSHLDIMKEKFKSAQAPWKRDGKALEQMDKYKTFKKYATICDVLSTKLDMKFMVQNLDEVMNPSLKGSENFKKLSVNREKREINNNDPLFTLKGYDYLIPISGFYCKLCNRTMCDTSEVEEHLRGYTHNYEHTKSVALDPNHEKSFRANLEKSCKEQSVEERPMQWSHAKAKDLIASSHGKTTQASASSSTSTAASASSNTNIPSATNKSQSQWSARLPYKKPTSKIVDEHDVIADKFEKRDAQTDDPTLPRPSKSSSSSSAKSPPKSKESPKKRKTQIPEIVPLSRTVPSASLKRLKSNSIHSKDSTRSSEKDKDDEVIELEKKNSTNGEKDKKADQKIPVDDEVARSPMTRLDSSTDEDVDDDEPKAARRSYSDYNPKKKIIDDDVCIEQESHLEPGDPDSAFPDLRLNVTGNIPVIALKDKRLKKGPKVVLNRINLDDYKDMMLDPSSLWARVDFLMTKKEPGEYKKDLETKTFTAPCYFQQNGETVPVDIDSSSDGELGPNVSQTTITNLLQNFFCDK